MKKTILLLLIIGLSWSSWAQFPEGFETAVPPDGWTSFAGANGEGVSESWTQLESPNTGSYSIIIRIFRYKG